MRRALFAVLAAVVAFGFAPAASAQSDGDYILLRSSAGDIIVELFDDAAPVTAAQVRTLIAADAYVGTPFARVIPNFVVQLGEVQTHRSPPLSEEQRALVQNLPLEVNNGFVHERGSLSMGRFDDPNSGTSSFSILIEPQPHLDGSYTVFGRVVDGMAVADLINGYETDQYDQPVPAVSLVATQVGTLAELRAVDGFDPGGTTNTSAATGAQISTGNAVESSDAGADRLTNAMLLIAFALGIAAFLLAGNLRSLDIASILLFGGLAAGFALLLAWRRRPIGETFSVSPTIVGALVAVVVISVVAFALASRLAPRILSSIGLLAALSAAFGLFGSLVPSNSEATGLIIFVCMIGFFRLLSRFESIGSAAPPGAEAATAEHAESVLAGLRRRGVAAVGTAIAEPVTPIDFEAEFETDASLSTTES